MNEIESENLALQYGLDDIEKEIEGINRALSQTPDDHPNMLPLLFRLGVAFNHRFNLLNAPDDINKAIEYTTIALTLVPDDYPELHSLLNNLGAYYYKRYKHLCQADDVGKAIEYISFSLSLNPEDSAMLSKLFTLAELHSDRFYMLHDIVDLDNTIEYRTRALALASHDYPELLDRLGELAGSHGDRFLRLGELNDVEKSIEYSSRTLELAPSDYPHMSKLRSNLGMAHSSRYEFLGKLEDLDKAIEHKSCALELTPDDDPELAKRIASVATSYTFRFKEFGDLGDIDKAIEYDCRALLLVSSTHSDFPAIISNLAVNHSYRFQRLGELGDLEQAIEYQTRAVSATPHGHPGLPRRLEYLGIHFLERFECRKGLGDLEKAIEHMSRALALTSQSDPYLSSRLTNLSSCYVARFKYLGQLTSDIEKAIDYDFRALALTPIGHPDRRERMYDLGAAHSLRFYRSGEQRDIHKAIEYVSSALELTPEYHPSVPVMRASLGAAYGLQNNHTSDIRTRQKSWACFREAAQSPVGSPRLKFRYAVLWAETSFGEGLLNRVESFEAYQTAIDLLPQLIWLGATTNQRYEDLLMAGTLAVDAAKAAIFSCDYALALEWLEHARCVVWNQSLMLRSPLDALHSSHPDLAARLQTLANQLNQAGSESRESRALSSGSMTPEQVAQEHRRLAQEYDDLLSQVRLLPGFRDFLQSMKAASLVRAARNGPVVVINCHRYGCDAILILPNRGGVTHVPLKNYTAEKAKIATLELRSLLRSKGLRERGVKARPGTGKKDAFEGVLEDLWSYIVKPVLDFLGYTEKLSNGPLPHITWCPTGALSFLPLHAAGDYSKHRSKIFDYAISSYTPTLAALLASTPSSLGPNSRLLAIGMASTPDLSPLPGTVDELACLKEHTGDMVGYSELMNRQATKEAVLDAMEQHDWVHLACHAHQDVKDPTKSGFFMHNGNLDLATINRRSFKNKGLAFLSACQTAAGDEQLPDEAIHLASGMLMAGYSSVIATMWSVMDADAPFVADKVYGQLIKAGKLGNGEAGRALHNAVGELRTKVGEKAFERWVPYIHIGS